MVDINNKNKVKGQRSKTGAGKEIWMVGLIIQVFFVYIVSYLFDKWGVVDFGNQKECHFVPIYSFVQPLLLIKSESKIFFPKCEYYRSLFHDLRNHSQQDCVTRLRPRN